MVYQSYRIWDGKTSLTGNPDATPEALENSYHIARDQKQLVAYTTIGQDGNPVECNIALYDSTVSADTIKADFDAEVARQKAAEAAAAEAAKQPTMEQQLAAMLLTQAQMATQITALQQANAALMLKIAGGK